jgi:hypothetical protein
MDVSLEKTLINVIFDNLTVLTQIGNSSVFGYVLDLPNTYLNASNIDKNVILRVYISG